MIIILSLITIFLINSTIIVRMIIHQKKRPEKTISWILILLFLPPIGLIIYIFLGRNWKINTSTKNTDISLKKLIFSITSNNKFLSQDYKQLIDLLSTNSSSPLFRNNEIKILNGGDEKFKYVRKELNKATKSIHLEYYIVKDDKLGNEIKDILIKKSKEGVKIKFIIDRLGSHRLSRRYIKDLKAANIDVVFYSYVFAPLLRFIYTQVNYRNHRKIIVIDNYVSFIGGINIGDEYLGKGSLGHWNDCHLMIKGDASLGLQYIFLEDYSSIKKINDENIDIENNINKYFSSPNNHNESFIQLVKSGPDSTFPAIMHSIIKMINIAQKEINIITPYFIPPEGLIDSLKIAALSGINISIIFPDQPDHFAVNRASRTYLAELLRCGVKVYLYNNKEFIHSKILTVDNKICNIGTSNMDIRSFELNYEINAIIYDPKITHNLNEIFYDHINNCREFTLEEYNSQSLYNKIIDGLCRLLSSIL